MKTLRKMITIATFLLLATATSWAAKPIKTLIVDGQNNHKWDITTPVLEDILEANGMFEVDVATSPKKKEPMDDFKPKFSDYDLVVLNYTGDSWCEETKTAFVDYVKKGGGVVVYHAANNAFADWPEYNEIIAVGGWGGRNEKSGPMIRWRDGKIFRDTSPGRGGSHPPQHEYAVDMRDTEHPITKGLPTKWMHVSDELYGTLRGPAKNVHVLATGYSNPDLKNGTGEHEPVLFTVTYGRGRVFHDVMGHIDKQLRCVGFITTFLRGCEWAATGKVTQADVPVDFPTADAVSMRSLDNLGSPWHELIGDNGLSAFRDPVGDWQIVGDAILNAKDEKKLAEKPGRGSLLNGSKGRTTHLISKVEHGDVEAHVEFMVPKGSNSGVYFQGRYEIQVFDSWGVDKPKYSDCGGIYQRWNNKAGIDNAERGYEGIGPRVNASKKPGEWQTFDIIFRAPRFDKDGKKTENARFIKVTHNGVVIHENKQVTGPTRAAKSGIEGPLGFLMLQGDHGPVAYRNVRIRPLNGQEIVLQTDDKPAAKPAAKKRAPKQAAKAPAPKPKPVEIKDPYVAIVSHDLGADRKAAAMIEQAVRDAGANTSQRAVIEKKLLVAMADKKATEACKQFVCRRLREVGTAKSVPALATLLKDKAMSHYARFALEAMACDEAGAALRKEINTAEGDLLVGVVESLGRRQDAAALPSITPLLKSGDVKLTRAAINALGHIATKDAVKALDKAKPPKELAALRDEALLNCAATMPDRDADNIYDDLMSRRRDPMIRVAALGGLARIEGAKVADDALDMLEDKNDKVRDGAAGVLIAMDDPKTDAILAKALRKADDDIQVLLIGVLAERDAKSAAGTVAALIDDENEAVRIAAIAALGAIGNSSNIKTLVALSLTKGDIAKAATDSLARLSADGVGDALATLATTGLLTETRTRAVEVLGARGDVKARPALLAAIKDDASGVRKAALKGLETLGSPEDLRPLLALVTGDANASDRSGAEGAIIAIARDAEDTDTAAKPVIAALGKAKSDKAEALLRILGKLGSKKAGDTVRKQLASKDTEMRKIAARAMGEWPNAEPVDELLTLAEEDKDAVVRVLALRSAVKLTGKQSSRKPPATVDLYKRALPLATEAAEKRSVLAGVAKVKHASAKALAETLADDEEVAAEARKAVEAIDKLLSTGTKGRQAAKPATQPKKGGPVDNSLPKYSDAAIKGAILLHGKDAKISGGGAVYESRPNRLAVGQWSNVKAWVSWEADIPAGAYTIEVAQTNASANGSKYVVVIGGRELPGVIARTNGWEDSRIVTLGQVKIDKAGKQTVELRPTKLVGKHFANVRAVLLRPVK